MGIIQVGVILGGNFLWWKFAGWELSSRNHPGGNFLVGSFHATTFCTTPPVAASEGSLDYSRKNIDLNVFE